MKLRRLRGSLLFEGSSNLLGALAATALSVATTVLLTRSLGKDAYGEYVFGIWLLFTVATVSTLGLPSTLVRFLAGAHHQDPRYPLLLGGAVEVATGLLAGTALILLLLPTTRPWTLLVVPGAAGVAAFSLLRSLLEIRLDYGAGAVLAPIPPGFALVAVVLLLAVGVRQPRWLVGVTSGAWVVGSALAALVVVRRARPPRPRPTCRLPPGVLAYFVTVSLMAVVDLVVWQRSEIFFLRLFCGSSDVAEYSVAYALAGLVGRMLLLFSAPLLPMFAGKLHPAPDEESRRLLRHSSSSLLFVTALAVTIIATHAAQVLGLLFGPQYPDAAPVLVILLLAVGLTAGNGPFATYLYATGHERLVLGWGLGLAVANILLDLMLIPGHGATGAAWANSITQLGSLGAVAVAAVKVFGPKRSFRLAATTLGALLIGTAVVALPGIALRFLPEVLTLALQLALLSLCLAGAKRLGILDLAPLLQPQAAEPSVHPGSESRGEKVQP